MADETPQPPGKKPLKSAEEKEAADQAEARKGLRLIGWGLQLALTVGVFTAAGWWGDEHWGWGSSGRQGLGFLGIAIGLYLFVKEAIK